VTLEMWLELRWNCGLTSVDHAAAWRNTGGLNIVFSIIRTVHHDEGIIMILLQTPVYTNIAPGNPFIGHPRVGLQRTSPQLKPSDIESALPAVCRHCRS